MSRERITQADVAAALMVSRPYVNQILSGKRQPSLVVAKRIQDAYGIPAGDFADVAA